MERWRNSKISKNNHQKYRNKTGGEKIIEETEKEKEKSTNIGNKENERRNMKDFNRHFGDI